MVNTNKIGLKIPDQLLPNGKPFFLNDKDLSEWVKHLPIANVGETSRLMFQTLRDFNRTQIPSKRRISSAEYFRAPLNHIATNLGKHYMGSGFPLSDKAYKIAILNRELHSGMATAYKAAIVDMLFENQGKPDHKLLVQAIHRAMSYLSRSMLLSVLVYDHYPKHIWRELHVLHRLATRYGVESINVEDAYEAREKSSSVDEAYRRCLLFSLASPYKMRQKENTLVYDTLLEWSHLATFHAYENAPEDTTIIIRQDTDLAPSHETAIADADTKYLLKLDASSLIAQLRDQFSESPDESGHLWGIDALDKSLVRQLIKLWSKAQKRSFVRTKLNFELKIAVGLRSIHKLISLGGEPAKSAEKQEDDGTWIETAFAEGTHLKISPHFSLLPMPTNNYNPRRGDFEDFGPNTRDVEDIEATISIWESDSKKLHEPTTNLFRTMNESAGGYCLDWKGEHIPKIQVGELIGVQTAMSANQYGVGMVRWLQRATDERLLVGVQMIAPNAMAVSANPETRKEQPPLECLLLPEVGTSGQPTSFICPTYPFRLGDVLEINEGENLRVIKLTRLLEASGAISQFQFVYIDQNEENINNESSDDDSEDPDFDNLWSNL